MVDYCVVKMVGKECWIVKSGDVGSSVLERLAAKKKKLNFCQSAIFR